MNNEKSHSEVSRNEAGTVLFQELTQQSENLINEPLVNGVVPQIISVNKNYETHEMNGHLQLKEFNEELETQHTHETKYPSSVLTNTNQSTTSQIVTTNILNTNKDGIYEELPKVGINNQINTSRIIDGTLLVSDLNSPIVTTSIDSSMMKKPRKTEKRINHIYTKEQKTKLRDLFRKHGANWKMVKYALETGIKEDYCRRLINSIKRGDDITTKKKRGPPAKHSVELIREIIEEVKIRGKSTREASKQLKVSPSSICRYMKKQEAREIYERIQEANNRNNPNNLNLNEIDTESPHLIPIVESGIGIGSETQLSQNQIPSIRQAEQINLNDQINVSDIGGNGQVPINPKLIEMNMNGIPLGIHSLTGVIHDPNTIQTIEVPLQEINVKPNEKEGVGIKEEEENGAVIEIAL
ncbi:hypothetical protein KM1_045940 [Entamoeba histolytica HM-3:IMSS]|uniref:Uncharacterized protein n=4 Tax=Entamoeba histolytica TaxID=5759 RepID=C4M4I5_ENTH1|nr:hypothetical protein EHI_138940 [Entamoeba histolytica HM-1:IMSS]EAL46253.1 hypothetical protein EHI_138940 [Entamoeba histolytica HM-1:IMSS]EMS14857.1 hypothetical protein KM1_045940 [Entamoeba histolytica HM-3:IMSS]ENY64747.1 hypothetical protein EHI7A_019890 [Entamoeba histolytica HM-1:IMSS-A]GAT96289.1 hypothetical protein CL6EHI_138940 [Entamoeba histolytica]|eukprot:XP_651642.1 hypothetical protein EHI_138940 [Entamoeba histolytica HM-1:IMSS]